MEEEKKHDELRWATNDRHVMFNSGVTVSSPTFPIDKTTSLRESFFAIRHKSSTKLTLPATEASTTRNNENGMSSQSKHAYFKNDVPDETSMQQDSSTTSQE